MKHFCPLSGELKGSACKAPCPCKTSRERPRTLRHLQGANWRWSRSNAAFNVIYRARARGNTTSLSASHGVTRALGLKYVRVPKLSDHWSWGSGGVGVIKGRRTRPHRCRPASPSHPGLCVLQDERRQPRLMRTSRACMHTPSRPHQSDDDVRDVCRPLGTKRPELPR